MIPDAPALADAADGLPTEPAGAAEALVAKIFGADDHAAVAATGELLRRAGFPLVSAAGPIIAMPEDLTIVSDPVDVEMLPTLTRSIRDHTTFAPEQLSETLQFLGASSSEIPAPILIGMMAAWGKDAAAAPESQLAGAAVRALGRARGELLVPAALIDDTTRSVLARDPSQLSVDQLSLLAAPGRLSGLDPLQFLLVLAHLTGDVASASSVTVSPAAPGFRRPAAAGKECADIQATPEAGRDVTKKILRDDVKAGADFVKEGAGESIGKGFDAYDKAADVVSTTLLLLGATIDLIPSPGATHFRHESGDRSRDVLFVANAAFSSPLAGHRLACWALAGIDVPPNGPLDGFRVRWAMHDSLPMLTTKHDDSIKLLDGEVTKDGVSTLWTYPRTESKPPKPSEKVAEQTVTTIVEASLDKDDFPFKLTDLLGIADAAGMALGKAWDVAVAWLKRVGLPTKRIKFPVSYHATNPYVIQSHTTMQAFAFANLTLDADLYSCSGPTGPWNGSVTLTGQAEAALIAAGHIAGAKVDATSGTVEFPLKFTLNAHSAEPQKIPFGSELELIVTLDPDAVEVTDHPQTLRDSFDRLGNQAVVGEASYVSGGVDIRELADATAGALLQGAEFPVVGLIRDDRCPGSSYWDDRFDNE